jgi:hypothetical protein
MAGLQVRVEARCLPSESREPRPYGVVADAPDPPAQTARQIAASQKTRNLHPERRGDAGLKSEMKGRPSP